MSTRIALSSKVNVLEQVKQEGVDVNICCGVGICGSCRATLVAGVVEYEEPPIACIGPKEVVLCCIKLVTPVVVIEI